MKKIKDYKIDNKKVTFNVLSINKESIYEFITVIIDDFKRELSYQDFLILKHRNDIKFVDMKQTSMNIYTAKDISFEDV
jgi:hypothetical protein